MGTLNLTTADNNLTLTVNGTLIKQLYANSTKVYQKWKTEDYTETVNNYDSRKITAVGINKIADIYKGGGGYSITYTADIYIETEKVVELCETFDAFYFVVYCNGKIIHTSEKFSTNYGSVLQNVSIGTWSNYGPNGVGNYNSIQPKIEVDLYIHEGTDFNSYYFWSEFPVITSKPVAEGTPYRKYYEYKYPFTKRAYISKTVSGTRRVEDN